MQTILAFLYALALIVALVLLVKLPGDPFRLEVTIEHGVEPRPERAPGAPPRQAS